MLKRFSRITRISQCVLVFAAAIGCATAADEYPSKPIKIMVENPAGGPSDTAARVFGEKLAAQLKQPVVIENRPGANGVVALKQLTISAPDGYTLQQTNSGMLSQPALMKSFDVDLTKDITPISLITAGPLVVVVPVASPYKNIDDLIAALRANPGKMNYANIAAGDLVALELLRAATNTKFELIRYNGAVPAFRGVIAGDSHFTITTLGGAVPLTGEGRLRILAVNSAKRFPTMQDLPAVGESALPELQSLSKFGGFAGYWWGLIGPAKLPREVVQKLYGAMVEISKDPEFVKRMRSLYTEPGTISPEAFASLIASESQMNVAALRKAGVVPQ